MRFLISNSCTYKNSVNNYAHHILDKIWGQTYGESIRGNPRTLKKRPKGGCRNGTRRGALELAKLEIGVCPPCCHRGGTCAPYTSPARPRTWRN